MTERNLRTILSNQDNLVRILDSMKEGIIAHDFDRRIFFFNKEAERITGYTREEVIGRDCHEAFGEPFCGERCIFRNPGRPLTEEIEHPVTIATRDGRIRHAEMHVTPIFDEGDEPFGVLAFVRDITDILALQLRGSKGTGYGEIIGRDSRMLEIYRQIRDLSAYDYPVHIYGETGTGKELVAEAVHAASRRAGAPFVPINCGALPEGLIESELFGHVKGAFTGALRDKKGRVELAEGGSLFLDEVAELPRELQVKLLRFLQTRAFEKVGGEATISVNVRLISATNSDLNQAVSEKAFREDLYYRLNVIPIHLPPLRERSTDIPLLVEHFMKQFAPDEDRPAPGVSPDTLSLLMDYHWPGNVRQLQNVLQYAIVKSRRKTIQPRDLPMELAPAGGVKSRRGPVKKLDNAAVKGALEKSGGNKARAARLLGVGRATLYRFLNDNPGALASLPPK
jgi:PAS domain S-box-containing protein